MKSKMSGVILLWYWFDGGPFLESAINDGFLKAENCDKMQFYLMWANHDVRRNDWNVYKYLRIWMKLEDETFFCILPGIINHSFIYF